MPGLSKYFAVSSDEQMSAAEMLRELTKDQICPIMTYDDDNKHIIPLFPNIRIAEQFAKRNTSRKCTVGTMEAYQSDIDDLTELGYDVQNISWPKKRKSTVVVIHLKRQVEANKSGYRQNIK